MSSDLSTACEEDADPLPLMLLIKLLLPSLTVAARVQSFLFLLYVLSWAVAYSYGLT